MGGMDAGGFGPFTTPSAVASFLSALRNDLGGTNIRFTVESVQGTNHKDSWTADNGTGTCDADWTKQADGSWKIHSDKITFTPTDPNVLCYDYVKEAFNYFEASYNADFTEQCGACYTDKCHVTVNGGMDAGGFGPFTTPSAVASFLSALRNDLGGTNIRFTVESVQGTNHKDSWTADNGTGTCDADWTKQADGSWKIHSDKITFTPTDPNVLCCDYVKEAFNYFEASYNADFTEQCGACYTDKCHVTVNGGMDAGGFGPFTTPSAVASFLSALRNDLGGTNIRFTVESVQG